MAPVFGEQERQIIRSWANAWLDCVRQQAKKLRRPKVSPKIANAIREHLSAGNGILAALLGVGSGTVQRVKREMARQLAEGRDAQDAASQTSSPSSQRLPYCPTRATTVRRPAQPQSGAWRLRAQSKAISVPTRHSRPSRLVPQRTQGVPFRCSQKNANCSTQSPSSSEAGNWTELRPWFSCHHCSNSVRRFFCLPIQS